MIAALLSRYRALPRAGRWLVICAFVVVLYFGVVERALVMTGNYRTKGDALAADIARRSEIRRKVGEASRQVEQLAGLFGQPGLPAAASERSGALEKRINTVFRDHRVSSQRTVYKDPSALPGEPPASLVGPRQRLERLGVELSFETDVATLMAIVQDLERAPEIAAVTKVNVKKGASSGRRGSDASPLQVNLVAEAWVVAAIQASPSRPGARPADNGNGVLDQ